MPKRPFCFERRDEDGIITLTIGGVLDGLTVVGISAQLDAVVEQRPMIVRLELAELKLIDSSGVGALVLLQERVKKNHGAVLFLNLQGQPLSIFRLLRLERLLSAPSR